jgi:hypothetical protein
MKNRHDLKPLPADRARFRQARQRTKRESAPDIDVVLCDRGAPRRSAV